MPAKKKPKGEVMFVVGTIDFQYNDETYYAPEGDAVTPVTVYRDRAKAEAAVLTVSLDALKNWDLLSFGYSANEVFSDPDAALELYQAAGYEGSSFDDLYGGDSQEFVDNMTIKQKQRLLELLNIKFARVREVVLGE